MNKHSPILQIPERKHEPVRVADLKRNTETLAEHRRRLKMSGRRPLTPEEEAALFPGDNGYV